MNLQIFKLDLEKAEEPEIKLPTSVGSREFQKNIYFCFIDYAKAFDCVAHNKLWKILKEMGIQDHLSHLLRNLDSILKRRDITLPTKVHLVKAMVSSSHVWM